LHIIFCFVEHNLLTVVPFTVRNYVKSIILCVSNESLIPRCCSLYRVTDHLGGISQLRRTCGRLLTSDLANSRAVDCAHNSTLAHATGTILYVVLNVSEHPFCLTYNQYYHQLPVDGLFGWSEVNGRADWLLVEGMQLG
jgi:hypothetical protein